EVANVVLVDGEPSLLLRRHRVELARGREGLVYHRVGHPVTLQIEEAHVFTGPPHRGRHRVEAAAPATEGRPEVDHGDRARGRLEVLHGKRLEDVHRFDPTPTSVADAMSVV